MQGNELSPQFAAEMASNVYLVNDLDGRDLFKLKYKNDLNINTGSMIPGTTGGLVILKKAQIIALFSAGKGAYKGQAFIAFKGTASLYDALTDLNTGIKTSHTGCQVHQGFYYAFDSVLTELREFIAGLKGIHTIHCVGHSLGGAIATLAADWIKASGASATVKLYFPCSGPECVSRLSPNGPSADGTNLAFLPRAYTCSGLRDLVASWCAMGISFHEALHTIG